MESFVLQERHRKKLAGTKRNTRGYLLFYQVADYGSVSVCSIRIGRSNHFFDNLNENDKRVLEFLVSNEQRYEPVMYHHEAFPKFGIESYGSATRIQDKLYSYLSGFLLFHADHYELFKPVRQEGLWSMVTLDLKTERVPESIAPKIRDEKNYIIRQLFGMHEVPIENAYPGQGLPE